MDLHFSYLTDSLHDPNQLDEEQMEQFNRCCGVVDGLLLEEVIELLDAMLQHVTLHQPARESLLDPLLARLTARQHQSEDPVSDELRERIVLLYAALGPASRCHWRLLQWLAMSSEVADLEALVDCVIAGPPDDPRAAALGLTPLFQRRNYDPHTLFPRLFAALQHLSVAAPVLDLSNYLYRSGLVGQHPAAERSGEMEFSGLRDAPG
jgi:hypothetical protein